MRDSARSNYSDSPAPSVAGSAPSVAGSHTGSQKIAHSRSASKTSVESGSSGPVHRSRADHRGEGDQKRPPRTPTRAPTATAGTPGGEGSRPSSRRRRPSGEGGGGGSGGGSGGRGGRRRRAHPASTPPSSDPRRHSHSHAKSRRTATTSSPRAGAAAAEPGAAGPSGVAPEPSPVEQLLAAAKTPGDISKSVSKDSGRGTGQAAQPHNYNQMPRASYENPASIMKTELVQYPLELSTFYHDEHAMWWQCTGP